VDRTPEQGGHDYILARGLLRHIVGGYVGFAPQLLQFRYNSHGKPALASEWGDDQLAFNLSHSHSLAVCSVTRAGHIGVDLEYMDTHVESDQIAERLFAPREASLLRQLPSDKKQNAFFSFWTRKEAYLKARGEGLSVDLLSFDVTFSPGQPASLLSVAGDSSDAQRWSLADLSAPAGHAAALAVEGIISRIQHWHWPA
jgi:4'-phosphopantetheinyl transferase